MNNKPSDQKTTSSDEKIADEHRDVTESNSEMDKAFKRGDEQEPPLHSDKVGALGAIPADA